MSVPLAELFASPDHYLHSFDGPDAIFVPMDRDAYRRSIFLDDRIQPAAEHAMRVPIQALLAVAEEPSGQTSWIFHVAHCGSTLLANALDELSGNLVLREPFALRQAAIARDDARLRLMLRMLAKRYPEAGTTLVKANVPVNFCIPTIVGAQPDAAAIFLYYGLSDYLLAIMRSDNHRAWLRRVTGDLAPHLGDLSTLSDAERAAALWLAQIRLFSGGLERMPHGRALGAEHFFNHPAHALGAAARLLGFDASPSAIEKLVAGPLFGSYAKNPAIRFDNTARIERRQRLLGEIEPELVAAGEWIERTAPDVASLTAALEVRRLFQVPNGS